MKFTAKQWAKLTLFMLFCLWFGIPTFNKWRADKLVEELCAKDGGIKVYEVVSIPKEKFDQWGQFVVPFDDYAKPNDEYYIVWKITNIQGRHESVDILSLTIYQHHFTLYRTVDRKILGESIIYSRRGGDVVGAFMPSSYSCPNESSIDLSKRIFKVNGT